ncbi:hypothetical protein V5799_010290 [Amblyomma americanum]|uniref:Uncharacterized protein n=1 Tax=Amblyomma americanum TaxID=6943 RepID=A0AAQ4F9D9_AMBAM
MATCKYPGWQLCGREWTLSVQSVAGGVVTSIWVALWLVLFSLTCLSWPKVAAWYLARRSASLSHGAA